MGDKNVSVVIPTCHGAATIERSIQSALHQNYQNMEIVIVDANEPDSS